MTLPRKGAATEENGLRLRRLARVKRGARVVRHSAEVEDEVSFQGLEENRLGHATNHVNRRPEHRLTTVSLA